MNKTEEELIWESYISKNKKIVGESHGNIPSEQYDHEIAGDFYFYHKDGQSIAEIAEEFDMEASEVKEWIKHYVESFKNGDEKGNFGLDRRHERDSISIDPDRRSDSIDYEFNPEYEENPVRGKSSVTDVPEKKRRPRSGLNRKRGYGEIK